MDKNRHTYDIWYHSIHCCKTSHQQTIGEDHLQRKSEKSAKHGKSINLDQKKSENLWKLQNSYMKNFKNSENSAPQKNSKTTKNQEKLNIFATLTLCYLITKQLQISRAEFQFPSATASLNCKTQIWRWLQNP